MSKNQDPEAAETVQTTNVQAVDLPRLVRLPSVERGCAGKMRMSLSESPHRKAQKLAKKHGKDFGIYRCPHCDCYHLTSKLEKQDQYAPLEYQTNFFEPNAGAMAPAGEKTPTKPQDD
jgi:hypothetical protein